MIHTGKKCCTDYFESEPAFLAKGTCYGSKIREVVRFPSEMEAFQVWVTPKRADIEYIGMFDKSILVHGINSML